MNDKLLDNTRMAVAKGAVKSLIKALPADTPLGLRVFKGCDNIAALIPIAKVDKPAFAATVDQIEPDGGTPIVASLLQSFQALAKIQDVERVSVIVTDGGESCNGAIKDAAEQAKELRIRVIVISFDIKEQTITEQLAEARGRHRRRVFQRAGRRGAAGRARAQRAAAGLWRLRRAGQAGRPGRGQRRADHAADRHLSGPLRRQLVEGRAGGHDRVAGRSDGAVAAGWRRRHGGAREWSEAAVTHMTRRVHRPVTILVLISMTFTSCSPGSDVPGAAPQTAAQATPASPPQAGANPAAPQPASASAPNTPSSPDEVVARAKQITDGIPRARYDLAAASDALGPGVEPAFQFVRDRIGFEPSSGVLRGAAGTLASRAGNALDRSLLLAEILKK